jgi:hypothetical protein
MTIRTTVDLPKALHDKLKRRAADSGTSMRALIILALEETYPVRRKGKMLTGPIIKTDGKFGPDFPTDENPHDLVLS